MEILGEEEMMVEGLEVASSQDSREDLLTLADGEYRYCSLYICTVGTGTSECFLNLCK